MEIGVSDSLRLFKWQHSVLQSCSSPSFYASGRLSLGKVSWVFLLICFAYAPIQRLKRNSIFKNIRMGSMIPREIKIKTALNIYIKEAKKDKEMRTVLSSDDILEQFYNIKKSLKPFTSDVMYIIKGNTGLVSFQPNTYKDDACFSFK